MFVTIATRHYTNNFVSYTHSKIHHGLLKFRLNIKVATQNCIESIQYQDESIWDCIELILQVSSTPITYS